MSRRYLNDYLGDSVATVRRRMTSAAIPITAWGVVGLRTIVIPMLLALGTALFSVCTQLATTALQRPKLGFWLGLARSAIFAVLAVATAQAAGEASSGVAGGGIPEVRALYTGGLRERDTEAGFVALKHPFLSKRTLLCKLTSLSFAKAAGLPVGKEGPIIHCGCCLAAALLNDDGPFADIGAKRHLRSQLVLCAVAAGVGAAFEAPISATLFAIDVIPVELSVTAVWKIAVAAVAACVFRRGLTKPAYYDYKAYPSEDIQILAAAVLFGVLGGAAGALFVQLNAKARTLLASRRFMAQLATAAAVAVCVAAWPMFTARAFLATDALWRRARSGSSWASAAASDVRLIDFECVADCAIRKLLSAEPVASVRPGLRVPTYAGLALRDLIFSPLALALPLTSGCVSPLFIVGAWVGAAARSLLRLANFDLPLSLCSFLGAASACASVTSLASAVALVELAAGSQPHALAALLAALIAKATAFRLIGGTYYDAITKRKEYRSLPRSAYDVLACATVSEKCGVGADPASPTKRKRPYAVPTDASAADIEDAVRAAPPELAYLPVVDRSSLRFLGALHRADVVRLRARDANPAFHLDRDADLIRDTSGFSVAADAPCADLLSYIQRADFAFVVTPDRIFLGTVTRDSLAALDPDHDDGAHHYILCGSCER